MEELKAMQANINNNALIEDKISELRIEFSNINSSNQNRLETIIEKVKTNLAD